MLYRREHTKEAGGSVVQGQPLLSGRFEVKISLGLKTKVIKRKKKL